jgi:hypothetical protein
MAECIGKVNRLAFPGAVAKEATGAMLKAGSIWIYGGLIGAEPDE